MSGFLEKCNEVGNRYSGVLGAIQVLFPFIFAGVIWIGSLYLNSNYQTKKEAAEAEVVQEQRLQQLIKTNETKFELISGQLSTIISKQTSLDGRFDTINVLLSNQADQIKSVSERVLYLERTKRDGGN